MMIDIILSIPMILQLLPTTLLLCIILAVIGSLSCIYDQIVMCLHYVCVCYHTFGCIILVHSNTDYLNVNYSFHKIISMVKINTLAPKVWINIYSTYQEGRVKPLMLYGTLESVISIPINT